MPCASTAANTASSSLNACSSVTTSGLTLQHPQAHDLRDILAGQLPPQTSPYYAPQFPPLHYQQPPQRFDFTHSIDHFQQTTPFGQTASAFHPQQQHPTHQQASANTNHRLIRQREQLQRLDSAVSPFSPDLVNGHFPPHSRRHDPIRLSNEPMDILPPAQLSGQSTPQVSYIMVCVGNVVLRDAINKEIHYRVGKDYNPYNIIKCRQGTPCKRNILRERQPNVIFCGEIEECAS